MNRLGKMLKLVQHDILHKIQHDAPPERELFPKEKIAGNAQVDFYAKSEPPAFP